MHHQVMRPYAYYDILHASIVQVLSFATMLIQHT
jgi:hypothetical protein